MYTHADVIVIMIREREWGEKERDGKREMEKEIDWGEIKRGMGREKKKESGERNGVKEREWGERESGEKEEENMGRECVFV